MKFGVNAWVWTSPVTTEELAALAPKVAGMGFDILEVPLEGLDDLDHARGAAILAEHGLSATACAAMGPDRDLIHPDAAIRESGVAYLRGAIDACQALGASNLVGPLYSAVGRTWQQSADERARDLDVLEGTLHPLAEYAADRGVMLGLEPLNRFETSFVNLASQAVEIVDRVGHPNLGIMLDTFHMNIEEDDLGEAIILAGDRLKQLHACGSHRGAPGSGTVPWDEVAAGLKAISYDGPVVIESFTAKVQSIARAAAIWRRLAESQDALAEEGLAFLKSRLA